MRNWLITGVSSGFGRVIAKQALDRGDRVVGTLRRDEQGPAFEALAPGRAKAVLLDVTDTSAVKAGVQAALEWLGQVDVLVNNAGYGQVGVFEELEDAEFRRSIETNFLGALSVIRALLPSMRERRAGTIINISSVAAFSCFGGLSAYGSAKAALDAFSEALKAEVEPFGIKVMVVSPGSYRTDFRHGHAQPERRMKEYDDTPGGKLRDWFVTPRAPSAGDPEKLAAALLELLDMPDLPARFVTGKDGVEALGRKLDDQREALTRWAELGRQAG